MDYRLPAYAYVGCIKNLCHIGFVLKLFLSIDFVILYIDNACIYMRWF